MSALAYATPATRPASRPDPRPTLRPVHREVVTTKAQRKARPKVAYAVVTVISLFAIFAAQLLLSIVVSDGAYQIDSLQSQQKELLRTQQDLSERLDVRDSTQNLAANAAQLGMVPGASPLFLDLQSGAVTAAPGTIDATGCGGSCNLVANSLLTGMPLVDPTTPQQTATISTAATGSTPISPQFVTALPAPVTH